ncbi:PQQ-binding-like beta-propeller repeat protein [Salinigranum marinum]|uniref:outer membrane protein assembly factor BamB family protein n=1 Tax=Salinigranum marinum TaxID=1515595 RepID=UPI00298A024D|nr:PQQ-binding-like beta-propeller repeat protein [Salinigranum marinum]
MPSRRRYLRVCATGLAATAGCVSVGDPTPTDTGPTPADSDPTPASSDPTPADGELNDTEDPPERVGTERVRWETDVAYSATNQPTLVDGRLFAGTAKGVSTLSPTTGDVQWSTKTDWPVQAPPHLVGETLVAVIGRFGEHYAVHGYDPETGERRWTFEPRSHRLRVLASDDETVFVVTAPPNEAGVSASETLFALASADGSIRWSVDVNGEHDALVANETVYVAGSEGVVAVETDGARAWTHPVDTYQLGTLGRAVDTLVFVTEPVQRQPMVHGVDMATGEQQWTFGDDWLAFTIRAQEGRLFVGGERLARLDPASGTPTWTVDSPVARLLPGYDDNRWVDAWRNALSDAPLVDGTLYVGGPDAVAVGVEAGTVEWRHDSDLALVSPVAVTRGNLLLRGSLGTDDRRRHLVCLDTATGEARWTFAGRFRLTEPVVDTERAYLAESRSGLLALEV